MFRKDYVSVRYPLPWDMMVTGYFVTKREWTSQVSEEEINNEANSEAESSNEKASSEVDLLLEMFSCGGFHGGRLYWVSPVDYLHAVEVSFTNMNIWCLKLEWCVYMHGAGKPILNPWCSWTPESEIIE
ncbi:unnamed protein product [Trichobilharzia regenti]|nr:unnamed protein product [Trichobilharzia regenti]